MEWLLCGNKTKIIENLVPESCIEQMENGMLCTSYIKINRHPVFFLLRSYELFCIFRVYEP